MTNKRVWWETYDNREDIDELYQCWCDNDNKPNLAVYLRTSKKNSNETNVRNQLKKLEEMAGYWIRKNNMIHPNGDFLYEQVLMNADIDYNGACVNDNLKEMLSELHFHDDVFIYSVSRVTRMNPESDEFIKLKNKLFSDYRTVYVYDEGKARTIGEKEFLNKAQESFEWYNEQKDNSKKGNEVKRNKKDKRINEFLVMYQLGNYTNQELANKFSVSIATIYNYIRELRKNGYITKKSHPNGRNIPVKFNIF